MKNGCYRSGGFTMLEVLLVIAILVILVSLILPDLIGRRETALVGAAKIQLKTIEDALEFFKTDIGRYPTTDEGLEALRDKSQLQDDELAKKWLKPYLKKGELKDPWGNEYNYVCPGQKNEDGFDLWSNGPDGQEGTDDDIKNWTE